MSETSYERAVARTGRKWPYRTEDWPCPACRKAECDLDVDGEVYYERRRGVTVCRYWHIAATISELASGPALVLDTPAPALDQSPTGKASQ